MLMKKESILINRAVAMTDLSSVNEEMYADPDVNALKAECDQGAGDRPDLDASHDYKKTNNFVKIYDTGDAYYINAAACYIMKRLKSQ